MNRSLNSMLYGDLPVETGQSKRRRMADLIIRRVTGGGSISRDELLGGGFSEMDIDSHFKAALAQAGVRRLAETV